MKAITDAISQRPWILAVLSLPAMLALLVLVINTYLEIIYIMQAVVIIVCYILFIRNASPIKYGYMVAVVGFYLLIYVAAPYHLLRFTDEFHARIDPSAADLTFSSLYILLAFFALTAGYRTFKLFSPAETIETKICKEPDKTDWGAGILLILIGLGGLIIYADIYGGFYKLYTSIDLIRSGHADGNELVFTRKLIPFAIAGTWLIASCVVGRLRNPVCKFVFFLFVLSVVAGASFVTGGRLDVLLAIIPVLFAPYLLLRRFPSYWLVAGFIGVTVVWLVFGDDVFAAMTYRTVRVFEVDSSRIYFKLVGEFMQPFNSLVAAIDSTVHQSDFRGLTDVYYALQSLLPERLLDVRVTHTVTNLNTLLLIGRFESTIPPGMLGFFYYSYGIIGLVLGSYLFGIVVRTTEYLIITVIDRRVSAYLYVAFCVSILHYMMSGDPRIYLHTYFWLYTSTLMLLMLSFVLRLLSNSALSSPDRQIAT